MMNGKQISPFSSFYFSAIVFAILLSVRHFQGGELFGVPVKKADILSDIVSLKVDMTFPNTQFSTKEEYVAYLSDKMSDEATFDLTRYGKPLSEAILSADTVVVRRRNTDMAKPVVLLEDYSGSGGVLDRLREALLVRDQRAVRIAFLGDSFIEGDIFTADVREMLQDRFGGRGVGFVPITSIVAGMRQTVTHRFEGWDEHSIKKSNTPQIDSLFVLSGYLFTPKEEKNSVAYRTTKFRKHLRDVDQASLLFVNQGNTELLVTLNDSIASRLTLKRSDDLQQLSLPSKGDRINSIQLQVSNPNEAFCAYGVSLHSNDGVVVDNFADRGSSGLPLLKLSKRANDRFNSLMQYDLIVLEYGINVLQKDVFGYKYFENKMVDLVNRLKRFYPHADIVIMGIGDRSTREDGTYVTMAEVPIMIRNQRSIAKRCGVAFFDVFQAMGGENSMPVFVEKGWASKDYVHLSSAGAKVIARRFVESLLYELDIESNK